MYLWCCEYSQEGMELGRGTLLDNSGPGGMGHYLGQSSAVLDVWLHLGRNILANKCLEKDTLSALLYNTQWCVYFPKRLKWCHIALLCLLTLRCRGPKWATVPSRGTRRADRESVGACLVAESSQGARLRQGCPSRTQVTLEEDAHKYWIYSIAAQI